MIKEGIGVLQEEVVHLFDHLLGSNAREYRMSEGYGITPAIQKIGQQIKEWYSVKRDSYPDAYAILNEREYLAQSVRLYLFDSDTLQFIDPDMYVFLQGEFFNNDFWREGLSK